MKTKKGARLRIKLRRAEAEEHAFAKASAHGEGIGCAHPGGGAAKLLGGLAGSFLIIMLLGEGSSRS